MTKYDCERQKVKKSATVGEYGVCAELHTSGGATPAQRARLRYEHDRLEIPRKRVGLYACLPRLRFCHASTEGNIAQVARGIVAAKPRLGTPDRENEDRMIPETSLPRADATSAEHFRSRTRAKILGFSAHSGPSTRFASPPTGTDARSGTSQASRQVFDHAEINTRDRVRHLCPRQPMPCRKRRARPDGCARPGAW